VFETFVGSYPEY